MAYTTINKSGDYFNTVLYTGTEPSNKAVTGVGFKPDFTWIKQRSGTEGHYLADIIRGSTYVIRSNESAVENNRGSNGIQSFDSDGFTAGGGDDINSSGGTFTSWNWLAGGSQGSSNTDGSINTTYTSVNTTAGLSISKFTGTGSVATVGHGLGVAPNWIIVKNLQRTENWRGYHSSLGNEYNINLSLSNAKENSSDMWNDTSPTSSVFTVGTNNGVNYNGENHIAYCFAEKSGYSKFGSYTGNGSTDGTFVYTGFKPAFVLIKRVNSAAHWVLRDNKRDSYNYTYKTLKPDANNAEAGDSNYNRVDFLSNGFKLRGGSSGTGTDTNGSEPYIYMSFAEAPLVGSNNVPCTAR